MKIRGGAKAHDAQEGKMNNDKKTRMIQLLVEEFYNRNYCEEKELFEILRNGIQARANHYAAASFYDYKDADIVQYDKEQAERFQKLLKDVESVYYEWEG